MAHKNKRRFFFLRSSAHRLLKWALVLSAIIFACQAALLASMYEKLPSESELRSVYFDNRDTYNQRSTEFRESSARHEQSLAERDADLGYAAVDIETDTFLVRYHTSMSGVGVSAYGAGLAHLDEAPEMIDPSLAAMWQESSDVGGFLGYDMIEGKWNYFLWEAD